MNFTWGKLWKSINALSEYSRTYRVNSETHRYTQYSSIHGKLVNIHPTLRTSKNSKLLKKQRFLYHYEFQHPLLLKGSNKPRPLHSPKSSTQLLSKVSISYYCCQHLDFAASNVIHMKIQSFCWPGQRNRRRHLENRHWPMGMEVFNYLIIIGGFQHDKHNVDNELMGMEVFNMINIMVTMN